MRDLYAAVAAAMPIDAYLDRAPRDVAAPYSVYVLDTIYDEDTSGLIHNVQLTVDSFARDTAAASAASALMDIADSLDAVFVRGQTASGTGASALWVLAQRTYDRDPEDDGVSWCRSVYTTQWAQA